MDNINMSSTPVKQGMGNRSHQQCQRKSSRFSAKLLSFMGAFLILLASVFAVNLSTINTVEAKSQSAEYETKKKKYKHTSRKSRRYKRSRSSRKSKKRYKTRYKKSRRYKKGKRLYKTRYKKSKRYRKRSKRYRKGKKGKRFYKAGYKKSKRTRKSKRYYKKGRKSRKRSRKGRRSRVITCDQLSASTLNKKARRYQKTIDHAARQHGVSQHFIKAVITVETCFRSGLRGTSGEKGLMQLMPATARRFGVKNRFSTWQNIHGGARYLSYLLRRFKGNKAYAAAAYNGGAGAVSRKTGPKFEAVRRYSRKVMNAYRKFRPGRIKVKSRKRKSRKKSRS
jgi:hypothetical protein